MVGTIDSYDMASGDNFYLIKIRLSTNYETIEYVDVVNYLFSTEQNQLEGKR